MAQLAIDLFTEIAYSAIPFSIAFTICTYITTKFLDAAFGRKFNL